MLTGFRMELDLDIGGVCYDRVGSFWRFEGVWSLLQSHDTLVTFSMA